MKKLFVLFSMSILCFVACQEDEPLTERELPKWLEEKIQSDEDYVDQNPKSMPAYGVWVSTKWKGDVYFEYTNPLSSATHPPISADQDTLKFNFTDYAENKCCSELVWRGNQVDDEYLALFLVP